MSDDDNGEPSNTYLSANKHWTSEVSVTFHGLIVELVDADEIEFLIALAGCDESDDYERAYECAAPRVNSEDAMNFMVEAAKLNMKHDLQIQAKVVLEGAPEFIDFLRLYDRHRVRTYNASDTRERPHLYVKALNDHVLDEEQLKACLNLCDLLSHSGFDYCELFKCLKQHYPKEATNKKSRKSVSKNTKETKLK